MTSDQIVHLYTLLLMVVFGTYCNAQNKTELPTGNTKSETNDVITSHGPNTMVRNIKQDRKGNILIASWQDIIRYDGKSFTNITSKVSSGNFWSVLEDRKGNLWFGTIGSGVYYYDGKSFRNYKMNGDFMSEDRTGKPFPDFIRPLMKLILLLKTKQASFGLVQGEIPSCMMVKHLPFSPMRANLLIMFVR